MRRTWLVNPSGILTLEENKLHESLERLVCRWTSMFPNIAPHGESGCCFTSHQLGLSPQDREWDFIMIHEMVLFRTGGAQVPSYCLFEELFGCYIGGKLAGLDPADASMRLRDIWWIVARSILDGAPLPKSMLWRRRQAIVDQ